MLKKIAALSLTAALAFAPVAAFAQDPTPAPTPAAGDAATDAKPMMKKHHMMKHHMMKKSHMMKHHMMKKKADAAPAGDAAPAEAPK